MKEILNDFSKYIDLVNSTLEINRKQNSYDVRIKADFDENLQRKHCNKRLIEYFKFYVFLNLISELRTDLETVDSNIKKELNRVGKDLNLEPEKTLKLETSNQLGYFFRITRKVKNNLFFK